MTMGARGTWLRGMLFRIRPDLIQVMLAEGNFLFPPLGYGGFFYENQSEKFDLYLSKCRDVYRLTICSVCDNYG